MIACWLILFSSLHAAFFTIYMLTLVESSPLAGPPYMRSSNHFMYLAYRLSSTMNLDLKSNLIIGLPSADKSDALISFIKINSFSHKKTNNPQSCKTIMREKVVKNHHGNGSSKRCRNEKSSTVAYSLSSRRLCVCVCVCVCVCMCLFAGYMSQFLTYYGPIFLAQGSLGDNLKIFFYVNFWPF